MGLLSTMYTRLETERLSVNTAGCTFDEDSDPSLCEFSQGEEDDFDWQLFRAHASPLSTSDLLRGKPTQPPSGSALIPPGYFTLLTNYFSPHDSILSGPTLGPRLSLAGDYSEIVHWKWKEGSVRATIQDETSKIQEYTRMMAPSDEVLSENLRQQKPNEDGNKEEQEPSWAMCHQQIVDVADMKKSNQWLERFYHTRQDPRCSLCKGAPETIQHITVGY
ncbi:hypothetical protein P4O66_001347 [Electrophorus voltai]|uniref:MAM domain-containing protein n=1 Tax=Electrophorus voltai TaxID=2609070 RepID=A0AAD9DVF5_9TELE|nr:hypothetical protein P4O66_001347 [Electrophorus voltai]